MNYLIITPFIEELLRREKCREFVYVDTKILFQSYLRGNLNYRHHEIALQATQKEENIFKIFGFRKIIHDIVLVYPIPLLLYRKHSRLML